MAVAALEDAWAPDTGVFWRLRQGIFSPDETERIISVLRSVSVESNDTVPRRLVELLWYVPIFMTWQRERVEERGGDIVSFSRAIDSMTSEAARLLGVP